MVCVRFINKNYLHSWRATWETDLAKWAGGTIGSGPGDELTPLTDSEELLSDWAGTAW